MEAMLTEFDGRPLRRARPLNHGWLPSAYLLGGMTALTAVTVQLSHALDLPSARRSWIWSLVAIGWFASIAITVGVLSTGLTTDRIAVWSATNRLLALGIGLAISRPLGTHSRVHEYYGGTTRWNILPWGIILVVTIMVDGAIGSLFPIGAP